MCTKTIRITGDYFRDWFFFSDQMTLTKLLGCQKNNTGNGVFGVVNQTFYWD